MAIPLRTDFDASALRSCTKRPKDDPQARRLLGLAAIYEGATRTEAARIGNVTLQIVCDWVMKFNAWGPDGLLDRKAPGQSSRLNDTHRAAIAAMIESGPIPAIPRRLRAIVRTASFAGASSICVNGCSRSSGSRWPSRP
jgi:transposase